MDRHTLLHMNHSPYHMNHRSLHYMNRHSPHHTSPAVYSPTQCAQANT